MNFSFFLRKNFQVWVGGWVGGSGVGAQPPPPPPPTGNVTVSSGLVREPLLGICKPP